MEEYFTSFLSIFQISNIVYLGILIGFVGLLTQIYINFIRPLGKKRILYYIHEEIISRNDREIKKIRYKGKLLKCVRISYIFFWNNGWDTINNIDIPKKGAISIIPDNSDTSIFGADLVVVNNSANDIKIRHMEENNQIIVDFDYLDNKNGGIVQIVNNGLERKKIKMVGEIKGIKSPINFTKIPPIRVFPCKWNFKYLLFITLVIATVIVTSLSNIKSNPDFLQALTLILLGLGNLLPQTFFYLDEKAPVKFECINEENIKDLVFN